LLLPRINHILQHMSSANLKYEEAGYFSIGDGRPPSEEETPSPEVDEIVVFREFFCQWPLIFLRYSTSCHS
jgi:hypothetical protein